MKLVSIGIANKASGYGKLYHAFLKGYKNSKVEMISFGAKPIFVDDDVKIDYTLSNKFWDDFANQRLSPDVVSYMHGADAILVFWDIDKVELIAKYLLQFYNIRTPVIAVATPDLYNYKVFYLHGAILPFNSKVFNFPTEEILPYGEVFQVSWEERELARSSLGIQPDERVGLYIGRWQYRKNPGQVISMIKYILSFSNTKVILHIPLEKTDLGVSFGSFVKEFSDQEKSRIILYVPPRNQKFLSEDEIKIMYAASDFVFSVSFREGLCLPVFEGVLSGLPAISPRFSNLYIVLNKLGLKDRVAWLTKNRDCPIVFPSLTFLEYVYNLRSKEVEKVILQEGRKKGINYLTEEEWFNNIIKAVSKIIQQPHWREI